MLELASKKPPSFTFTFETFKIGHFITSINSVKDDPTANLYWMIYKSGILSKVGIDKIIPSNGDTITFKYEKTTNNGR